MQLPDWLRVVVVGGSVVAVAGSATSNQQTGFYPRPQGQQAPGAQAQQPPPQAPAEPGAPAAGSCEGFCGQIARCNLGAYDACVQECRTSGAEQEANGPASLAYAAQQSCEQLAAFAQQPAQPEPVAAEPDHPTQPEPAPPAPEPAAPTPAPASEGKRTQWVCSATGWWQKCEGTSYTCYAQTTTMTGFGSTEALARTSSESLCNTAMSRMMSVNFTYRTSVTQRCKAMQCSPPNAR